MATSREIIEKTERYGANNYHPLDVVLTHGEGVWVWDVEGNRYMDMLSAYSALSHGHRHPRILKALTRQAAHLTLTSRAFHNDKLCELYERVVRITGLPRVLPMNTGAEAVETALKAARKWGYTKRGVAPDRAQIICCCNNFHGRTVTIVSFSTEEDYRKGFGPFTPGFSIVEYGNVEALRQAITDDTVAFLVEPIQGEAGINVPPAGYMAEVAALCRKANILLVADEIQTGFGRTGTMFCCEHDQVRPDIYILGKALGGGVLPVSAIAATEEVMGVFAPGQHGSTFGGNPLAAAVGAEAIDVLIEEDLAACAAREGAYLMEQVRAMNSPHIREVRGRGLLVGLDLWPQAGGARRFCEALKQRGILAKETHESVIRLAPPLIISRPELDWALEQLRAVLV